MRRGALMAGSRAREASRRATAIALALLALPMVTAGQQEPAAGDSAVAAVGGVATQTLQVPADGPPLLLVQVVEAESGRPIPGLQVFLAGTEIGGLTDDAGRLDVYAPASGAWRIGLRQVGRVDEWVEVELERSTVTQILAVLSRDRAPGEGVQLLPPLPGPSRGTRADTTTDSGRAEPSTKLEHCPMRAFPDRATP